MNKENIDGYGYIDWNQKIKSKALRWNQEATRIMLQIVLIQRSMIIKQFNNKIMEWWSCTKEGLTREGSAGSARLVLTGEFDAHELRAGNCDETEWECASTSCAHMCKLHTVQYICIRIEEVRFDSKRERNRREGEAQERTGEKLRQKMHTDGGLLLRVREDHVAVTICAHQVPCA